MVWVGSFTLHAGWSVFSNNFSEAIINGFPKGAHAETNSGTVS